MVVFLFTYKKHDNISSQGKWWGLDEATFLREKVTPNIPQGSQVDSSLRSHGSFESTDGNDGKRIKYNRNQGGRDIERVIVMVTSKLQLNCSGLLSTRPDLSSPRTAFVAYPGSGSTYIRWAWDFLLFDKIGFPHGILQKGYDVLC